MASDADIEKGIAKVLGKDISRGTCIECVYAEPYDKYTIACYRYPPVPQHGRPVTSRDTISCGEFVRKEKQSD